MVEITYQMVLSTIQTLSLIVGIIYYLTIMRNNNNARQREMIIQRSQSYSLEYTRAFLEVRNMTDWEDAEEWEEKYGRTTNPEARSKWLYIMRLYTLAGLHLKEGADPDLLFELYPHGAVMMLWEQFEPVIRYARERSNNPRRWKPFEYLYNEAKKRYPDITPSWR